MACTFGQAHATFATGCPLRIALLGDTALAVYVQKIRVYAKGRLRTNCRH